MTENDKLALLKKILLDDEHEFAESINQKIERLENVINEQKKLSQKVNPIIDDKLDDFVKDIPHTLGPTITQTLKSEIQNSQDAVVDALYPIMGKMIKKYVQAEIKKLSETINEQVNDKFSFKFWKRKAQSRSSGVSEGDLILKEALKPKIEQIMVIEKGSGLLVAEYSKTESIDEDMVAAMLTAIKSFVEDAFVGAGEQQLELIEYELYHIHIQNFASYYIAVVISGALNTSYRSDLEDRLLDFAQNVINETDLNDKDNFETKLKNYFRK